MCNVSSCNYSGDDRSFKLTGQLKTKTEKFEADHRLVDRGHRGRGGRKQTIEVADRDRFKLMCRSTNCESNRFDLGACGSWLLQWQGGRRELV